MASPVEGDNDALTRDPFRPDRLADELATRESSHPFAKPTDDLTGVNLPEYIPLSHEDKYLTAEVFNVEEFLMSRSRTSLPDLRVELRQYLAKLKEELVQLINDDYEAFISLSTDLRDEGARLERLKHPLGNLKTLVLVGESKVELQTIQRDIHDKLSKRARLREEKALLHLLLKISESVIRLESLLIISSPEQDSKESIEINKANLHVFPSHSEDPSDDKLRGNRAKHLGRVSAEYTQLLYYVRKARAEKCAFVDGVQWRIHRVHSTLSSDLDQVFAQTLSLWIDPKVENKASELEKIKWTADLTECLRTYDILGLWRDAEDVIRREVVRNFVKKTIYPGALAAPHSPIVPNTPFHSSTIVPMTSTTMHHIPYTPFTAFVPKSIPYRHTAGSLAELPQAQLLEDGDDPLTRLYNQLLRFVEWDVTRIMDLAEKVTVKPTSPKPADPPPDFEPTTYIDTQDFQIMANVVWDELARSIMSELGGIVFSSGRPSEFRRNYETTQAFIRSLELLAPSMRAIEAMRSHPTYIAFKRRWQLPVYFQLRWKEIVGALEETLTIGTNLEPIVSKDGSFSTSQGSATWIAISACWSSEIYIPELSHRFWRLTLQILSRYKSWISEDIMSTDIQEEKNSTTQNQTRANASGENAAENTALDDSLLRRYAAAIIDIRVMETNVNTLWRQIICEIIPDALREESAEMENALQEATSGLVEFTRPISDEIISILTKRCCECLLPVRSIPSQFRAMSNKRMPVEPSYFVASILRPIKQFFAIGVAGGPGDLLKDALLGGFSTEIFNNVTQKYIGYLAAMKKTEESLKRLKKGKKSTFSLFGNTSNINEEAKDEERIRNQMILDVEAFGKDGESLKVDVATNTHFAVLKEMVYATDLD